MSAKRNVNKNQKDLLSRDGVVKESYTPLEQEMMDRNIKVLGNIHKLEMNMLMDQLIVTFSRILVAVAIVTLGMIILSSFDIPYVDVNPEFVKLLIGSVIVEITAIVSMSFLNRRNQKNDEKESEEEK